MNFIYNFNEFSNILYEKKVLTDRGNPSIFTDIKFFKEQFSNNRIDNFFVSSFLGIKFISSRTYFICSFCVVLLLFSINFLEEGSLIFEFPILNKKEMFRTENSPLDLETKYEDFKRYINYKKSQISQNENLII